MKMLNDLMFYYDNFGIDVAYKLCFFPRLMSKIGIKNYNTTFNDSLVKYLLKEYGPVVKKYKILETSYSQQNPSQHQKSSKIIWTCWWQGKEQMPKVIRMCHQSLLNNSNGHKVILITKDNFRNYVEIPQYIIDIANKGLLSLTHMGDVVRTALLAKHGGIWVDAGLFITRPIIEHTGFFSPKILSMNSGFISEHKWCVGMLETTKDSLLFSFVRDCFYLYLSKNNCFIDYFQFDFTIKIAYSIFDNVKSSIDAVPFNNPDLHSSRYTFNEKINENRFKYLIDSNQFMSLTWRINYEERLLSGEQTYYGRLIEYFDIKSNV